MFAMKNIFKITGVVVGLLAIVATGCQKMERPELGDFVEDANPPGGPLKFFAAFDGQTSNPLMNAVDSVRANFPASNPLTSVEGVSGQALQGEPDKAVSYASANDFKSATSFTIAFWMKRSVNANTEFVFSLMDDTYSGWHYSAIFMMMEHTTPTEATVKIGIMDQWLEFAGGNKLQRPMFDGNWHHWAMTYDETTSKMTYYFDGVKIDAPASVTDVKSGGNPRGPLDLSKSTNLVIGGWNRHASLSGPTDGWISSFQGNLDQFRMYSTVLSAAEIKELFDNRQ
jgi:hypothetical protein